MALETAAGLQLRLSRGAGGLRARRRDGDGEEREWTIGRLPVAPCDDQIHFLVGKLRPLFHTPAVLAKKTGE